MPAEPKSLRRAALLLVCAAIVAGVATVWLGYLLWVEVPAYAARNLDAGGPLSQPVALAMSASRWFVRLLPLLVLIALPGLVLSTVLGAIAINRGVAARVVFTVAAALLAAIGLCELCAAAFVTYALR